jgi:hypothetical protein
MDNIQRTLSTDFEICVFRHFHINVVLQESHILIFHPETEFVLFQHLRNVQVK